MSRCKDRLQERRGANPYADDRPVDRPMNDSRLMALLGSRTMSAFSPKRVLLDIGFLPITRILGSYLGQLARLPVFSK